MRLRDLCDGIVADVDGCLGCAVVDLTTGLPLAMQVVPGTLLSAPAMEVMSAASVDYFRGRTIRQLQHAMSGGTPEAAATDGFVREIQTTTEDTYHFMSVVPGREDTLLILITDKTANLGLGWIAMRQALARIREVDAGDLPATPASAPGAWVQATPAAPNSLSEQAGAAAPAYVPPAGDGAGGAYSPPQGPVPVPGQQAEGQVQMLPEEQRRELFQTRWRGGHGVRGHPTTH